MEWIGGLAFAVVLVYGGDQVVKGRMTAGEFFLNGHVDGIRTGEETRQFEYRSTGRTRRRATSCSIFGTSSH